MRCSVAYPTRYGRKLGRPVADPALSVLFPGGVSYYADASLDKQPARMDLLAELLHSRIHPRLLLEQVKVHARDIRAAAKELRTAVDAVPGPNERVELLQRVRRALATVAHAESDQPQAPVQERALLTSRHSRRDSGSAILGENFGSGPAAPAASPASGSTTASDRWRTRDRGFRRLHACRRRIPRSDGHRHLCWPADRAPGSAVYRVESASGRSVQLVYGSVR